MSNDQSYALNPTTGTTTPIYVSASPSPKNVKLGQCYFWLQVKSAQAYFSDQSFFYQYLGVGLDKIKNIVVTSQVKLDGSNLDEAANAIHRTRELKRSVPEQLGLSPNLVKLVPATMTQVTLSIVFLVDKENRLAQLAGMINQDSFLAPISLAPGASAVIKTVGVLAQKVIEAFIPANERKPILQFSGDFNLADGSWQEGYYVIIGSRDTSAPLPSPTSKLSVQGGSLLVDGKVADQLSYIILELRIAEARTREAGANTSWAAKLREAETLARMTGKNPLATDEAHKQAWEKTLILLNEANILLSADTNYLPGEAERIFWTSFEECKNALFEERVRAATSLSKSVWVPDTTQSRARLGIPIEVDLDTELDEYAQRVMWARKNVPKDAL